VPSREKILANPTIVGKATIVARLARTLDPERFKHCLRAEKIALALARKFRVNQAQVSFAALLHDCSRRYSRRELLKKARALGLKIDPIRKLEPKLFHAEISASLARKEFGIKSPAVLRAIAGHTTGNPKMTKLEKIIYLADHVEQKRTFPGVNELRRLAFQDLDQAVFEASSATISYLLAKKLPIYPPTVETRNAFLK
jgi:predicted HD superfamily hydrolase involved in NAD metabolism